MRMFARLLVAVVVAFGAPLLPGGTASAADSVVETVNVWQWNVSGWKMNDGSATTGMVEAAAASIVNRDADFAAFNELCWSQYKALQERLKADGWPEGDSFARFATIRETTCHGEPFGIALFSRRQLGTAQKYDLPEDQRGGVHKLLCAPLDARPHLRFCTTHITGSEAVIGGSSIKEQQLAAVRGHLQDLHDNGDTVLIAGDFNARPDDALLDPWYAPSLNVPNNGGNTGAYRELDDEDPQCPGIGETTVNAYNGDGKPIGVVAPCGQRPKIDLILVRESAIAGLYTGDALGEGTACNGPCSDHRVTIGTVPVRIQL